MPDLGSRIREARKSAGLTQVDLAARLGVTQGTISEWETGTVEPATRSVVALCEALGVSADTLLGTSAEV